MQLAAPHSLNHVAYPTWDSRVTHDFYTRVLRCEFTAAIRNERIPSTGKEAPHLHTFFQFGDGGCIAFFEVVGLPPPTDDGVPSWIRHLALNVDSIDELEKWNNWLTDQKVDVTGPVDHDGLWRSLYFFDPNGIRLEFTVQSRPLGPADAEQGERLLAAWNEERDHDRSARGSNQ